ncbi:MAG: hypothetical protein WBL20_18735 [Sphingobium sp.]|uniref:hypothetical protein n=1 Tax=Sphingobium sp. TaxID=1912891 RepID=UPI002E1E497A
MASERGGFSCGLSAKRMVGMTLGEQGICLRRARLLHARKFGSDRDLCIARRQHDAPGAGRGFGSRWQDGQARVGCSPIVGIRTAGSDDTAQHRQRRAPDQHRIYCSHSLFLSGSGGIWISNSDTAQTTERAAFGLSLGGSSPANVAVA